MRARWVAPLLLMAACSAVAAPPVQVIELFCAEPPTGLDAPALRGTTVKIHRLDALPTLEAALSADLPNDPAAAKARLVERLSPDVQRRLAQAWSARLKAAQYGIRRLPAAVINGDPSWVVHGTVDLRAIAEAAAP